MAKAGTASNAVPIARLLAVENQMNKLTTEMEKLILVSTQHGSRIKELIVAASNSVSQVDMMSTVTMTRFQHMNDLKALRKNLQAKYEELSSGNVVQTQDDMDDKDVKALNTKIDELHNEMSNANFKAGMEVNKLKMELKSTKKDYDELKRYVTVLETKLGALIEDAKSGGIKTSVQMDDMPEITYQPTLTARRASILNPDAGIPTTPQSGRRPSSSHSTGAQPPFMPLHMPMHVPAAMPMYPGVFPVGGQDPHGPHSAWPGVGATEHPHSSSSFPVPGDPSAPSHFPLPGQQLDAEQLQQLQTAYQHQVYAQQQYMAQQAALQYQHQQQQSHHPHHHHSRQSRSNSVYVPGMPMTDSGLSTPVGASPGPLQGLTSATAIAAGAAPMSAAFPPYMYFPCPTQPFMSHPGTAPSVGQDPDAAALRALSAAAPTDLTKEERFYKAQFRALKELILASMEAKDLKGLEPEGLNAPERHHRDPTDAVVIPDLAAPSAKPQPTADGALGTVDTGDAASGETQASQLVPSTVVSNQPAPTRRELLAQFDLRHRNRYLYRNMRRVKEVEKIAMSYADFCVNNAINCVDDSAYRTFRENVIEEQFALRLRRRQDQSDAEAQTEAPSQPQQQQRQPSHREVQLEDPRDQQMHGTQLGSSQGIRDSQGSKGEATLRKEASERDGSALSALQELRSQQQGQDGQGGNELDLLAQLMGSVSRPALDFGAAIEPTQVQYSSTGRRQSLMQMGCVFEEDLRDPALRFLEATVEESDEECEGEGDAESLGRGSNDFNDSMSDRDITPSKPSSRDGASRSPSFAGSPLLSGPRSSMLRKHSSFPMAMGIPGGGSSRRTSSAQSRRLSARKFSTSEAEHADLESLRAELTALMDRKLLRLYQGLDDRWKGLDETNLSVLHKLTKFQDVLVVLNGDSQRLQVSLQLLAQRLAKTDARTLDALEPVYIALDDQKANVTNLEGLMVDVARQLKSLDSGPVPAVVASQAELSQHYRREQLPIEQVLKNSHRHAPQSSGNNGEDYLVEGLAAPVPASANMSEHEVELMLRQLKEYATLYKDMVHNYECLNKRLLEEDKRRSGNFSLTKPHVSRTVSVKPPAATMREFINTPYEAYHTLEISADLTTAHHCPVEPLVVHMPHANTLEDQSPATSSKLNPPDKEFLGLDVTQVGSDATTDGFPVLMSQTGPLPRAAKRSFDSPHRVLTEPFRLKRAGGGKDTSAAVPASQGPAKDDQPSPSTLAARMGPLTRRDLLRLVECSDLSGNVEIIRIKNELARLRTAMTRKDANTPTSRQSGQHPPAVFPSLFSGLDSAGFSVAKTQAASPGGSLLRAKTPQSRSGKFSVETVKPVLAGSLLPPTEQHASQRGGPSLAVTNGPGSGRPGTAAPLVFEDSASLTAEPSTDGANTGQRQQASEEGSRIEAPPHAESPLVPEFDVGYRPSSVEDEDGLHQDSLSAYEFLINPAGSQELFGPLEVEPPSAGTAAATHSPIATSRKRGVSFEATSGASEPRGAMWGSSAIIGHTTLNPKYNPSAALQSPARASLLPSPAQAAENMKVRAGAVPGGPRSASSSGRAKNTVTRSVDQALRTEAIVAGEAVPFALTGSVKTTAVPTPMPPTVSRPPANRATTGAGGPSRPSIARIGPASPSGSAKQVRTGAQRSGQWTAEQVWQRPQGSAENSTSGGAQDAPFVMLQGGTVVTPGGEVAHYEDGTIQIIHGMGAAGARPQRSVELGENAFD